MGDLMRAVLGKVLTLVGFDGTHFYSAYIDSNGHLRVNIAASSIAGGIARETTLAEIMDRIGERNDTQDGSTNYELNQITRALTYNNLNQVYAHYSEVVTGSADSGQISVVGTQVPDGYWRVITGMFTTMTAGSADNLNLNFVHDGANRVLKRLIPAATNIGNDWQGIVVLAPGDYGRSIANNVTAGSTVNFQCWGYDIRKI